jgi:hypothetical protein
MVIDRRAVLAFFACTLAEARTFSTKRTLHQELRIILADGMPLCPPDAVVSVRAASEDEAKSWRRHFERALTAGEISADEHAFAVFLVPVTFPT